MIKEQLVKKLFFLIFIFFGFGAASTRPFFISITNRFYICFLGINCYKKGVFVICIQSRYNRSRVKKGRNEIMSRILVVVGANVHGNTDRLAEAFIKGAKEAENEVTKIVLNKNILGCIGCHACQHNGHHCVIQDQMQDYYSLFAEADMVVLASPLYFWSISARLK